jgi:hypothetical protein
VIVSIPRILCRSKQFVSRQCFHRILRCPGDIVLKILQPFLSLALPSQEFGYGVAKGSASLLTHSLGGAFGAASSMTGAIGNFGAVISMVDNLPLYVLHSWNNVGLLVYFFFYTHNCTGRCVPKHTRVKECRGWAKTHRARWAITHFLQNYFKLEMT